MVNGEEFGMDEGMDVDVDVDENMDEETMSDEDGDEEDDFDVTLRTPSRLRIKKQRAAEQRANSRSPSPSERQARIHFPEPNNEQATGPASSLAVPARSVHGRTDSVNTLSSDKLDRMTSEGASLTSLSSRTVSHESSAGSRAPSMASKPSGGPYRSGQSDSDASSLAGTKRPRPVGKRAQNRGPVTTGDQKQVIRQLSRGQGPDVNKTVRQRQVPPTKRAPLTSLRPDAKNGRDAKEIIVIDDTDTLDSADETTAATRPRAKSPKKKRKMVLTAAAAARPGALQRAENKIVPLEHLREKDSSKESIRSHKKVPGAL